MNLFLCVCVSANQCKDAIHFFFLSNICLRGTTGRKRHNQTKSCNVMLFDAFPIERQNMTNNKHSILMIENQIHFH